MKLRILIVILVVFGVAIPCAQAQDVKMREVYISGIGSDKNEAIKDALSKAVAQVCGQRVSASQNIENDIKSQANYSSDGKVSSVDRTKRSNEKVNALSDGIVEKYEILSETIWAGGNIKLDISAAIGRCFEPDSVSDQLVSNSDQTNKLLSKVLTTMDENSDPRGIKPNDDRWDVMAKEMWYANFLAYKRQGQFKNEDQAKLALERGFHNRLMLEQALDQEIFSKLDLRKMSNLEYPELLSEVSESNVQYSTYFLKAWDRFKKGSGVTIEIIEKCGSYARSSFFVWGDSSDVWSRTRALQVSGELLPCISGGLTTSAKMIGVSALGAKTLKPLCAELDFFSQYDRSSELAIGELGLVCSARNDKLSDAIAKSDIPSITASQRLALLGDLPNAPIIADYLNIKHSGVLENVKNLETATLLCHERYGRQPIHVLDTGPAKARSHCKDGLPISFAPRPFANGIDSRTLVWGSIWLKDKHKESLNLEAKNDEDKKFISQIVNSFCDSTKELRIQLNDKSHLSNRKLRYGANLDEFFELFCS